ncbi:3'-5' exonuclease [Streptomyces marincola]|uniref:DNA polymerase III subunit epsilon n=1 Tax=Streptomyces marincola TaxID=2878388 RepID=A0A1W7CSQ3_9ACTN|nr:3'-5' exonuclease [Streptomyces marincola]ARQ67739.1 DNA polymerase III subunit epsilon [Streptomyces marincola]
MNHESCPRLLAVDIEGNGAIPPDLVEIAVLPIRTGCLDIEAAGAWLVRPPIPVTSFATRLHKLTNADLADCPEWPEVAEEVNTALGGAWICAHNASVEYRVLRRHLPAWTPAGVVDTLRLARATYPDAPKHTLDALTEHVGLDLTSAPGQRHRASYDAFAAARLLLAMATHYSSWEELAAKGTLPGSSPPELTAPATPPDTLF